MSGNGKTAEDLRSAAARQGNAAGANDDRLAGGGGVAAAVADGAVPGVGAVPAASPMRGGNYRIVALVVSSSAFMQYLDTTVLTTALPTMARSLSVSMAMISIAPLAYLITLAMLIPVGGALAGRFGARLTFQIALLLFTLGSLLCGVATSLPLLAAARVLQGVGGAIMLPVGRLIVVRSADKSELLSAMNWLLIPAIVGPLVGPPLGGFLTTYMSWRWIFFINLPMGVAGLVLSGLLLPPLSGERKPFDFGGVILSAIALAGAIICLIAVGERVWWLAGAAVVCALAGGIGYARHARRHADPVLDFRLMRAPTFAVSLYSGVLLRAFGGASSYLFTLQLQIGFGMTAAQSGAMTALAVLGALGARLLGPRLVGLTSLRNFLTLTILSAGATALLFGLANPLWPRWAIQLLLLVSGVVQSLPIFVLTAMAYVDVPVDRAGAANTLYTTSQQSMSSVGIAVSVLLVALASGLTGQAEPGRASYALALTASGAFMLLAVLPVLRLRRSAGAELIAARK